jgi:ADP-ribose pyrophosphatase YjhB (NUDIX family)
MVTRFGEALSSSVFAGLMAVRALLRPVALGAHAICIDRSGKVLLVRHSYMRGWSLPGGGVGRGEPAVHAVVRELNEELGTFRAKAPVFVGLFTNRSGWATNVVALYQFDEAEVEFRPNLEVREIVFCDPANPPSGTTNGTRRRLAELVDKTLPAPFW